MTCPGATSRLSTRPHPLCRTCQRFRYAADPTAADYIRPALIDSDGVATCPDRVHAGTVRADTDPRAPTCGGLDSARVGVGGNTA